MSGRGAFWRIQIAAWSLYGIVHFLAALPVVAPEDRWTMAFIKLVRAASGLGVSSLLLPLYRRVARRNVRQVAVIALLASAVASQLWFLVDRTLLVSLVPVLGLTIRWSWFPRGVELDYVFVLVAWSAAFLVVHGAQESAARERRSLERELALRDAQLTALGHQLSPHFLFNALNSLRSLIAEDAGRAREMVTRLAQFLNATLDAGHATTLAEELATVRAYLAIQQVRFEHALDAEIHAGAAAEGCPVPTLCLQPLVENAIKHGIAGADGVLRLRIEADLVDHRLHVVVRNTGVLAAGAAAGGRTGVGLSNARARLASFYGSAPELRLAQDGAWVRAEIAIEHPERAACAR